jgi:hypothetical protein
MNFFSSSALPSSGLAGMIWIGPLPFPRVSETFLPYSMCTWDDKLEQNGPETWSGRSNRNVCRFLRKIEMRRQASLS